MVVVEVRLVRAAEEGLAVAFGHVRGRCAAHGDGPRAAASFAHVRVRPLLDGRPIRERAAEEHGRVPLDVVLEAPLVRALEDVHGARPGLGPLEEGPAEAGAREAPAHEREAPRDRGLAGVARGERRRAARRRVEELVDRALQRVVGAHRRARRRRRDAAEEPAEAERAAVLEEPAAAVGELEPAALAHAGHDAHALAAPLEVDLVAVRRRPVADLRGVFGVGPRARRPRAPRRAARARPRRAPCPRRRGPPWRSRGRSAPRAPRASSRWP